MKCVHGRNRIRCKECGTGYCKHNRQHVQCKDCNWPGHLSRRVGKHEAFKAQKLPRPAKPLELLGCTYQELATHLGPPADIETDELNHIIPIGRYDLRDPVDQMRAFNYKNTQLLSHNENVSKFNSLPDNATLMKMKDLWPRSWWPVEVLIELSLSD